MKCHDIQMMISGFIEQRLTDDELEDFLQHIAECRDCYDELEAYYMITTGLMQLDEKHTGTLDFKRNLQVFIAEQKRALLNRQRTAVRRRRLKTGAALCLILLFLFGAHIFMTSESDIQNFEDFYRAAVAVVQNHWFGGGRTVEMMLESESGAEFATMTEEERMICRIRFVTEHPPIPAYIFDAEGPPLMAMPSQ